MLLERPRRNRVSGGIREMVAEAQLRPSNLIWPMFVQEGEDQRVEIPSMPGIVRYSIDQLVADAERALEGGVPAGRLSASVFG